MHNKLASMLTLAMLISISTANAFADESRAKVTGIGGVFFLADGDPKALSAWYEKHLGVPMQPWGGGLLLWKDDQAEDGGMTIWGTAPKDSDWFAPSKARFMINYRVDNLEKLIEQLKAADIAILSGPEYHENGSFAWLLDPAGNKIVLWDPKIWNDANKR